MKLICCSATYIAFLQCTFRYDVSEMLANVLNVITYFKRQYLTTAACYIKELKNTPSCSYSSCNARTNVGRVYSCSSDVFRSIVK